MLRDLGEEIPWPMLDEGRFVERFSRREGSTSARSADRQLEDIILYQFDDRGARAEVRAKSGTVDFNAETRVMEIDLRQVRLTEYDKDHPDDQTKARTLSAESYPVTLDLRQMLRKGRINKKPSDMTFAELVRSIQNVRQTFPDIQEANVPRLRTKMAVDANKRLALAMSCFSFTLLAIPLGIRSHRKESSIGIALALVLMFAFYLFIIIADALVERPEWRPDMIPWIPVLGSQLLGCLLLFRHR